jgi:hypothetical protein
LEFPEEMTGAFMARKNVVIRSFNLDGETQCVDIFRRPDGAYGFEEYRREPEDGRGWFAIGHYSSRSFNRESDAMMNAKASISWFASVVTSSSLANHAHEDKESQPIRPAQQNSGRALRSECQSPDSQKAEEC